MLVKYWMRKSVITVNVNDSMQDAISRMKEYFVPLLPVLQNGKLVGVITELDLKRASASDATSLEIHELVYLLSRVKCGGIMSKNPVTVPPDYTLEETAAILLKNKISGAPVVDAEGRIVGIIGQRDLFRALVSLSGFEKRGLQFAFEVEDRPGTIKELTDTIRKYDGRLVSILTSYDRAREGHRHLYVRTFGIDRALIDDLITELQQKSTMLYMVDHHHNKREEYAESGSKRVSTPSSEESGGPNLRKILLCTDFSDNSVPARNRAVEYAKNFGGELYILHVVKIPMVSYTAFEAMAPLDFASLEQSVQEKAVQDLDLVETECRKHVKKTRSFLRNGIPAQEIVRFAEYESIDLIVMGTHGWSGFKHLILGSTAENVVRTAKCPVLTVRAPSEE